MALIIGGGLPVEVQERTEVELGRLEELNLADVDLETPLVSIHVGRVGSKQVTNILQRVDTLGGLLNLTANDLGDQLGRELSQGAAGGLALHNFGHLLADGADLGRASVGGLLDLVRASLREGNGKQAEQVVIGSLDGHVGLDQGLPLAHKRAKLVCRKVHAVEVGEAVLPLDLVHPELDLAESVVLVVLQVSE